MDTLTGADFLPTEYVDISDTIDLKLEALNCHQSQLKWMLEHDNIDFADMVRTCCRLVSRRRCVASRGSWQSRRLPERRESTSAFSSTDAI